MNSRPRLYDAMTSYQDYTINIAMTSALITPLQSDTLFGHICWAVHYLNWAGRENKLQSFLNAFTWNANPPLLISNGFPQGYLCKPILPPITQKELDDLSEQSARVQNAHVFKSIKQLSYIHKDDFKSLQEIEISGQILFERMYRNFEVYNRIIDRKAVAVQHNTVNRASNRVDSGLYSERSNFFRPCENSFEVYLRTSFFSKEEVSRIFEFISIQGYGKKKSFGKGAFTFNIADGIDIKHAENPNAFMTLSHYMPRENDPVNGYYLPVLKFGKLGGEFAKRYPFKKPLLMFSAGSVFEDPGFTEDKIYGRLVDDIHKYKPEIQQFAFAFPIGIRISEDK